VSTEIYCFVEVRRDGRWEKVGPIFPNPYWQADVVEDGPRTSWYRGPLTDRLDIARNYDLFGILAGVRNPDIEPVVRPVPRGVPEDASPEYRARLRGWGDVCSSWVTLAELQAYDWNGPGAVRHDWDDPTFKPAWEEYNARRVAAGKRPADGLDTRDPELPIPPLRMHTRRELAGRFVTETMPRLADLGAPEDVRLVFFFS
jgi:hypothetical protein